MDYRGGALSMDDRVFYHIYPFGFCGAARENDYASPAGGGLRDIAERHIARIAAAGFSALYIGPLFESSSHGYDTVDYFWVDRRLGCNDDLRLLSRVCHEHGVALVLDAVFNHSGRHFFAFKDIQRNGAHSVYCPWYAGLDFSRGSPLGDAFDYRTWAGHYSLPKFDGGCPALQSHLLDAAEFWIREFGIDGLRLDAAADLSPAFIGALAERCRSLKPDFWLMGEAVGGDYRLLTGAGRLASVTNYELYKSLWSSLLDHNFYELSWTLRRQFGGEGMYRQLRLYNFADNHDVDRVASSLRDKAHLPLVYGLLFTLPGIPSVYYGSEFGIAGTRTASSDSALRPRWDDGWERGGAALRDWITALSRLRSDLPALRRGGFRELYLRHGGYAFLREDERPVIVLVNSSHRPRDISVSVPVRSWADSISGEVFKTEAGGANTDGCRTLTVPMPPVSFRLLA